MEFAGTELKGNQIGLAFLARSSVDSGCVGSKSLLLLDGQTEYLISKYTSATQRSETTSFGFSPTFQQLKLAAFKKKQHFESFQEL